MKKELKDYINLYLGCKVALAGGESYILKPSNLPNNWQSLSEPITGKLILRPLSDMIEEEFKQFKIIADNDASKMVHIKNVKEMVTNLFHQFEATRFLLSKHFDLFGLIEAGIAIDKTTLPCHLKQTS